MHCIILNVCIWFHIGMGQNGSKWGTQKDSMVDPKHRLTMLWSPRCTYIYIYLHISLWPSHFSVQQLHPAPDVSCHRPKASVPRDIAASCGSWNVLDGAGGNLQISPWKVVVKPRKIWKKTTEQMDLMGDKSLFYLGGPLVYIYSYTPRLQYMYIGGWIVIIHRPIILGWFLLRTIVYSDVAVRLL